MKKFEYKRQIISGDREASYPINGSQEETGMNALGKEGWRLVYMYIQSGPDQNLITYWEREKQIIEEDEDDN